jgi:hypothetical protein
LHMPTLHGLPDESAVTEALKTQNLETGVYMAPGRMTRRSGVTPIRIGRSDTRPGRFTRSTFTKKAERRWEWV